MTATATPLFLHTPPPSPYGGRDPRVVDVDLLHPTGYHGSGSGRLFEHPPAGAGVFPGADIFPKAALTRPSGALVYQLRRAALPAQVEVVARTPNRIVEILEVGYEAYRRRHCLPAHVREAARMILRCRTSALGGHVEACPDGHIARIHYNSCGHRFCPRCGYRKRQRWIAQQREKLLPVRHFHVTFTIPREFNDLWWLNVKQMATDLFHAAAQALQELLAVRSGLACRLASWRPCIPGMIGCGGIPICTVW